MSEIKASDLFVQCLEAEGVTHIFGVPGEENADFMISLKKSDSIEFVLCRHEQAAAFMADIEVLAKQTHEIAVRKKYRTGALFAHQRRFLSEMGVVAGNPGPFGGFTYAGFAGKPVNPAFAWAKVARAEKIVCGFNLFLQQPFFIGFDIC